MSQSGNQTVSLFQYNLLTEEEQIAFYDNRLARFN